MVFAGGLEDWRRGDWRVGGLEDWRSGGLEEWRSGGLEEWRSGGVEGLTAEGWTGRAGVRDRIAG